MKTRFFTKNFFFSFDKMLKILGGGPPSQHTSKRSTERENKYSAHSVNSQHWEREIWQSTLDPSTRRKSRASVINVTTKLTILASYRGIWKTIWKYWRSRSKCHIHEMNLESIKDNPSLQYTKRPICKVNCNQSIFALMTNINADLMLISACWHHRTQHWPH